MSCVRRLLYRQLKVKIGPKISLNLQWLP